MGLRGPVLVATNLSEAADRALAEGYAAARALKAPFVVCHVLPEAFRIRMLFPHAAGIDKTAQAALEEKAAAAVRARLDEVVGRGHEASLQFESGSPHAGILEIAARIDAGVIVMGPGRTAQRVARSAQCPVLVARPALDGGGVLGATDFSDPSLPAVRMAADEAARRGVPLRLLHCLGVDETAYLAVAAMPDAVALPPLSEDAIEQLEASARERLRDALATAGATGEAVVTRRSPGAGIVEAIQASPTSLVVVGTHGRTGLRRLALGSVAEDILGHAPCSVLVVPIRPEA
ncbi:MAG: universal stress protein [Acidobacteriota bacterium]